jgi:hypothetical protein
MPAARNNNTLALAKYSQWPRVAQEFRQRRAPGIGIGLDQAVFEARQEELPYACATLRGVGVLDADLGQGLVHQRAILRGDFTVARHRRRFAGGERCLFDAVTQGAGR